MNRDTIAIVMFPLLAVAFVFLRFDPWLAYGACGLIALAAIALAIAAKK